MDCAAHQDKGCIESLLIDIGVEIFPGAEDHLIIDAFLLTNVIYAHVTKDAKTQLSDLLFVRW